MAAKEVMFGDSARARMVAGINILADAVKVTPARRAATSCWSARSAPTVTRTAFRRQGNRTEGQVRQHGRADGQGSRFQDLRHRR